MLCVQRIKHLTKTTQMTLLLLLTWVCMASAQRPAKADLHTVVTRYETFVARHSFPGLKREKITGHHTVRFEAFQRAFTLDLVPDTGLLTADVAFEVHDGTSSLPVEFDASRFLVGTVSGEPGAHVRLMIHNDLALEGVLRFGGERYMLEPAHKYFDDSAGRTVAYKISDLHIDASRFGQFCGTGDVSPQAIVDKVLDPRHSGGALYFIYELLLKVGYVNWCVDTRFQASVLERQTAPRRVVLLQCKIVPRTVSAPSPLPATRPSSRVPMATTMRITPLPP